MDDNGFYLMIQNPGVAPVEGFTVFGVSTARDSGNSGVIGKFGSGNKHAVNVCLRNDISPIVYCGNLCMEFYVKPKTMNDGLVEKNYGEVHCRFSGTDAEGRSVSRDKDLSFALEYGVHDWTDLSMGLREFVSNAIDRTIRETGKDASELDFRDIIRKEKKLSVEVVTGNKVRAKAGFTRVFIPFTQEVATFMSELGKRFLHFSEPDLLNTTILPKRGRNISDKKTAMIYRKGVFVREVNSDDAASVFDYNFCNDELQMDEARNVDDWRVKYAAAQAMRMADVDILTTMFLSLIRGEDTWEGKFDSSYLCQSRLYDQKTRDGIKTRWQEAWQRVAADAVLVSDTPDSPITERILKKGFKVIGIKSPTWLTACDDNDVRTSIKVLTKHETSGLEIIDATPAALEAVQRVWGWIAGVNLTGGKEMPPVKGFRAILDAGTETLGFYDQGVVYINQAHSDAGVSRRLLMTAFEEVTHYLTGATDNSRDFQSFLLKVIIEKFATEAEVAR